MSGRRARATREHTRPAPAGTPAAGYVLRVVGLAGYTIGINAAGDPAGKLVERLDVNAYGGRGELILTDDPTRAHVFPTFGAAWEAWREQSTTRPLRPDGEPNRPGTAYTVAVEPLTPEADA